MYTSRTKEKKLPWGGRVFVTTYPAHGSVSFVGSMLGGSQLSHPEIAKVHAAMLLEGTRVHSKKELQRMLDTIGASLSFYATHDRLCFAGRVRGAHLHTLLVLIVEMLTESTFPEAELAILKKREEAALALEAQDTRAQAGIAFARALFSVHHPNYSPTTLESRGELASITHASLLALHRNILNRQSLILSLAGNITPPQGELYMKKYFSCLPTKKVALPIFPKASPTKPKHIALPIAHKSNIDYLIGRAIGIDNNHADFPALVLGLQILGSPRGFTGRLMRTVREQEGLTYAVYAYTAGFFLKADGYICIWGTFAPKLFVRGRKAIMRELKLIVEKGVTETEAKKHREMFEARTRVRLSTSEAFAQTVHDLAAEGRALTYLDAFSKRILALSPKDINLVLARYLKLDWMVESAAGPVEQNVFSRVK